MIEYPWYQVLDKNDASLSQGDFIERCPIIIPPENYKEGGEYDIEIVEYDVIVMTQSCDLENNKVDLVLVCPFIYLSDFIGSQPPDRHRGKGRVKLLEALRQGHLPSYHLLNQDPEKHLKDFIVIDFRTIYNIKKSFLQSLAVQQSDRIRLLSPYKEHLSQSFARFFMRVGLPQVIPRFK